MFFELITTAPALVIAWVAAIVIAMTVHEFSHALVANLKGDRTAEREGRLTLNPLAHVDLGGFIMLLLLGFGWAKPVPYNPYNLKNPKWDAVAIGLAGPFANFLLAVVAGLSLRGLLLSGTIPTMNLLVAFLLMVVIVDLYLMIFNLIPVHPLDGGKLFFALFDGPKYAALRMNVATWGPQVLMFLVILSFFGPNVFGFIAAPAFGTCDTLVGTSCAALYMHLFP